MFTKACEYGIRACLIVAQYSINENRISLKEIATSIDSPEAFTAKILQKLVKNKILYSIQGPQGGFGMTPENIEKTTLQKIVYAIDGDSSYTACVLGLRDCSDKNPCPAHKKYKHIKADFLEMIHTTTVADMVNDVEKGLAFLKLNED
ncbi:MAG: Rrf2 family transcriptional regulator [Crocinitomicaceae bacterium]|nr:Rrf2 family transcriptional regulator [Crocinitomicaceae bacterium]